MFKSLFKGKQQADAELEAADEPAVELHVVKERAERVPAYKTGYVTYPTGYRRDCAIVEYSRTGLRLRFPTWETMPDRVRIKVPALRLHAEAKVVWQDQTDAGLHLLRPVPPEKKL